MKTKIYRNANYIGWIVIIITFIFIYFLYFFIYIPKKEAQLEQKSFRILKEYGNNMVGKHAYYDTHFKNYGVYYSVKWLEKSKAIKAIDSLDVNYKKINSFVRDLFSYVTIDTTKKSIETSFDYSKKRNKLLLNFYNQNTDEISIDSLKKYYVSTGNTTIDTLLKTGFSNIVPIDIFMEGLKFDELFENIVLFNDSIVYYNSNHDKLVDITNPGALCDSTNGTQGGIHKTLNIRGKVKHIMIMPIDFTGERFCIAGFISDTDYRSKTRTINKQLLIFIAGILLLVFVGIPILKIFFIDPHERLKATDASGSGISILFGIGLIILIVIGFSKNQFVDQTTQVNRIRLISDALCYNVTTDIDSIKNLSHLISHENVTASTELSRLVRNEFINGENFRQVKGDTLKSPFLLNEIILIDSEGIVKKAVTRTAFSDVVKVNLSEREYFKNAYDINNSWPTSNGLNFYIESIKSYNTGDVETAVSFNNPKFDNFPVLAITSAIPSLYHQVLPKDIEFVIIDKTGKVLYHSIKEKNLHENFIHECESDLRLIKAINSHVEDELQLNYNEKNWLARIVPIKDTPLYHITLLDLNQSDNKNARIFLFTFYFLIASLILAGIGMLTMSAIMRSKTDSQKNAWFLNWLILYPSKYHIYKALSYILTIIIIVQFLGIFIIDKPVSVLFYQLIFIYYVFFISLLFLYKEQLVFKDFIQRKYFLINLVVIIIVLLIFIFQLKFKSNWHFVIPIITLLLITVFIPRILKHFSGLRPLNINSVNSNEFKIKRTYLVFLFLWLTSISAIPVIQYYFSIKNQEEIFWKQEQLKKVAQDNLDLYSGNSVNNEKWFKRIQGNGIDFLKVSFSAIDTEFDSIVNKPVRNFVYADKVYASLPDPITNWYNQSELLNERNYVDERFINNTLFFRKGLQKGSISVNYSDTKPLFPPLSYALMIFFVFIIIAPCIWFLMKYLASVLLNLHQEKPAVSGISWFEILKTEDHNRILLSSFNRECFFEESGKFMKKNNMEAIATIQASQIITPNFKSESLSPDSKATIWISGLKQIIYEIDKHEKFISFLMKLNQNPNKRIIVDLSFDTDLINEFYDDYTAGNELKPEELTHIFLLRKKWKNLFEDYFKFNGYLDQNTTDLSENQIFEDSSRSNCKSKDMNSRFSNIWSNLTSHEKIVLFDLADDGLLNRKNKTMIQKLINKRLVIPDPNPAFFSDEFRDFVRKSIKSDEIKAIETKLGLKGRWHNARYLIFLILIPITAFIIITQGISVEKTFGIFAGGLAIITGLMRLFDSSSFKQGLS